MSCNDNDTNDKDHILFITLILILQAVIISALIYLLIHNNKKKDTSSLRVSRESQCDLNEIQLQQIVIHPDASVNITAI